MDENIDLMPVEAQEHEKLKVFSPQIVVSRNNPEKPCYSITYYDIDKKEWCNGFGSYYLENVQKWFREELEEVEIDWEAVTRCEHCTIKKAVQHKDGIVWRCPHRTGDVKPEGFCEYGRRAE